MSTGPGTSKALRHRREAAACGVFAANAQSAADRELLLRMQRSLLTRAYHEDWLDGLPPPAPPAGCNSLALPALHVPDRHALRCGKHFPSAAR
jgi:hypothetical protein